MYGGLSLWRVHPQKKRADHATKGLGTELYWADHMPKVNKGSCQGRRKH